MNWRRIFVRSIVTFAWAAFGAAYALGFDFWGTPNLHILAGTGCMFLAAMLFLHECTEEIDRWARETGYVRTFEKINRSDNG